MELAAAMAGRRKGSVLQALIEDLQHEAAAGQTDVEIIQSDRKIVQISEGLSYGDAIDILQTRLHLDEESLDLNREYNAHPFDGAHALATVLTREYGFTSTERGWWFENKPTVMNVETGPGQSKDVIWGKFKLPDTSAVLETGFAIKPDKVVFKLTGSFKRVDQAIVRAIADLVERELQANSLYRGKAIEVTFKEDPDPRKRDLLRRPTFLNLSNVDRSKLVLSKHIEDRLDFSLFTVLRHADRCIENGIPLKRGVLMHGTYGTGKTMTAHVAAQTAVENGWTFIYARDNLAKALQFAQQYQPAMVFFEDIDRDMEERDEGGNELLEIMDGVGSKGTKIVTVLTTNNIDLIHEAALRPGRFDDIIEVEPPDAEACIRLVRTYGGDLIDPNEDLTEAGQKLNGMIPAMIHEIVTRAKLSAIRFIGDDQPLRITAHDVAIAAETILHQREIMDERMKKTEFDPFVELGRVLMPVIETAFERATQLAFDQGRLTEAQANGLDLAAGRTSTFIRGRLGQRSNGGTEDAELEDGE